MGLTLKTPKICITIFKTSIQLNSLPCTNSSSYTTSHNQDQSYIHKNANLHTLPPRPPARNPPISPNTKHHQQSSYHPRNANLVNPQPPALILQHTGTHNTQTTAPPPPPLRTPTSQNPRRRSLHDRHAAKPAPIRPRRATRRHYRRGATSGSS